MTGQPPVRDDLVDVVPYGAPQLDVPIRLNTNETPWAPPPAFFEALSQRVAEGLPLHRYPDRDAVALRTALADRERLPVEQVWVANGSNEILSQLFACYGGAGRSVLLPRPGYSAHPLLATVTGTAVVEFDLAEDFSLPPEVAVQAVQRTGPALVCLASPNNPTGLTVQPETVRALHDSFDGLVVLDEAYVELADDPGQGRALLDELDRLVVVRTFSKAWRLAGLRLGYLLAPAWVVEDLLKVRLPYHLDALTQAAGLAALDLADEITSHIQVLVAERARVLHALGTLDGVTVWPSAGNFILLRVDATGVTAAEVFDRLLADGILIRDFSTKPRLDGCLRVSIGTPEENDAFLTALGAALTA
ncbi:histidinol-phosphate transaminase [Euzebya tangerina]|uniref:histidinol-phosphate transaminase n=1 Tax=Euzebya tangerina TaxID=591198 RepID=UPI000E31F587|nr:histidinol-phosphate transaminase [Euzebya tangerina]